MSEPSARTSSPAVAQNSAARPSRPPERYRSVLLALVGSSGLAALLVAVVGFVLDNPVVVDAALALALATGALLAIARDEARAAVRAGRAQDAKRRRAARRSRSSGSSRPLPVWSIERFARPQGMLGGLGGLAVAAALTASWSPAPGLLLSAVAAAALLGGAALSATSVGYFAAVDSDALPEARDLARGGRLLAWVLVCAALGLALAWSGSTTGLRWLHLALLAVIAGLCLELWLAATPEVPARFPAGLHVLRALGSRANPLASLADAAQRQLGIDLRSTWAVEIVRRSTEPLVFGIVAFGWCSTALTVVGVEEQGLVERLGVPVQDALLEPGLHVHWPWPIDRVVRIPVRQVQTVTVGHEGEEAAGPESVLWARQHEASEYTLLLGDGRDLIAIDAAVRFRISDPAAWRYRTQNPMDALRAIAHRAVMKSTVGLTLAEALSENVVTLTQEMRERVQADADQLGLGVHVVTFTLGGMHPPVSVAADYQAVVSAGLDRATAAIRAQAYRNELVPAARAKVIGSENAARAQSAVDLARASGEAWSFRSLEAEVRAAPEEYRFRRRLEALETGLKGRHFTVLDARIQRDGGELWLTQ